MAEEIKVSGLQLQKMFDAMKESLEQTTKDQISGLLIEFEILKHKQEVNADKKELQAIEKKINDKVTEMGGNFAQFMEDAKKNQQAIDTLIADQQKRSSINTTERKSFSESMLEEVEAKRSEIEKWSKGSNIGRANGLVLEFKMPKMEVKTIETVAVGLPSAGGMVTYNQNAGIVPSQNINFRNLVRTVPLVNGHYVTYRETNAVQQFTTQTDGSAKFNATYTFVPSTKDLVYIAGFVTFTKQLMFNIPWLQQTLPIMLLRDFYKKENAYFFNSIASNATGGAGLTAGASGTADIEELIKVIAKQRQTDFNADVAIVDWTEWGRILITKPNDYGLPAGVLATPNGNVAMAGVPLIGASWAQSDHVLVWDSAFIERVEADTLKVEFSFENQDNFEKNQVTARCECFEEINMLRPDAFIYYDFGNS